LARSENRTSESSNAVSGPATATMHVSRPRLPAVLKQNGYTGALVKDRLGGSS
jgi:hypothetical protein